MSCRRSRHGIFYHKTLRRVPVQLFCCFQKHFRIRLGMRDLVTVHDRIKEICQTDLLQNERRVFAGRADA